MTNEFTRGYQAAMHDAALIADGHAAMHRTKDNLAAIHAAVSASAIAAFIEQKARDQRAMSDGPLKVTDENECAGIYGAMNLLDEAVWRKGVTRAHAAIESWLNEDDQDRPAFHEALAQGVQDAISHAMLLNEGKCTITIVNEDATLIRFDWFIEDGPSKTFEHTVMQAVKKALREGS